VTLVKRGPLGDRDSDGGNTVHTFPVRIVGRIPRRRRARVKITCPTRREEAAALAYYHDLDTDDSHGTQTQPGRVRLGCLGKDLASLRVAVMSESSRWTPSRTTRTTSRRADLGPDDSDLPTRTVQQYTGTTAIRSSSSSGLSCLRRA
jgi:hypothetical protein